jgi:nitrate reductase gamma subunit
MDASIREPRLSSRETLRVGGIATLLGGVGAIVVNVLHPRPPQGTDELLTLVASMPHWTIIHYGAVLATVLIVSGLALLVRTLQDSRARALGEAGKYTTTLGAAVFLVAIMVDGHGYPTFASRWMEASGDEKSMILWAASAVHTVDAALFPVWSSLFLGLGVLLVAVALWLSAEYPRIVAAFGLIGGSMCLTYALSTIFGFTVPLPLWPLGPAIDGIWLTVLGVMMVRKPFTLRREDGREVDGHRGS